MLKPTFPFSPRRAAPSPASLPSCPFPHGACGPPRQYTVARVRPVHAPGYHFEEMLLVVAWSVGLGPWSRSTGDAQPNTFHLPPYFDQIYSPLSLSSRPVLALSLSISSAAKGKKKKKREAILALLPFWIVRFEPSFLYFFMHFGLIFLRLLGLDWGARATALSQQIGLIHCQIAWNLCAILSKEEA